MSLEAVTKEGEREYLLKRKAARALQEGVITRAEYDFFLEKELGLKRTSEHPAIAYAKKKSHEEHKREAKAKAGATLAVIILLSGMLWAFNTTNEGLTGYTILSQGTSSGKNLPPSPLTITSNQTYELNASGLTRLAMSGNLTNGSAEILLEANNQQWLVWQGSTRPARYSVTTDKTSYALNETVNVSVEPAGASVTLWLTLPSGEKEPVFTSPVTSEPGTHVLDALINDSGTIAKASTTFTVRNETNTSNDTPREEERTISFTDACLETCALAPLTGTITITISVTSGKLVINEWLLKEATNNPPFRIADIPDVTLAEGEETNLSMSDYFTDPEGDPLTYDFLNVPNANITINGSILTIKGTSTGESKTIIYASDLEAIAESNIITITVQPASQNANNQSGRGEGTTTNETRPKNETKTTGQGGTPPPTPAGATNKTNESSRGTRPSQENATNTTSATTTKPAACDNPDPNQRPPECFIGEERKYFREGDGFLIEDRARNVVARFNALGNLLIRGGVFENAAGAPAKNDFAIGHLNDDYQFIPTVWISSETGDLYLKGGLHEEELTLTIPRGMYSFQSRRGINLGYANPRTGDLYLRGNLIPYRRNVQ